MIYQKISRMPRLGNSLFGDLNSEGEAMWTRARRIKNDESLVRSGHELITLESAHDPNGHLRCDPGHVGSILHGHPNR
jgi:hypothetical protein